ncbi:MAG TPA: hypothetical protein PKA48_05210, partial [Candidatus Obscuribacter sp.]|nr:hypothetical protein [Candidatus Obscuribacter sp.]
RKDLAKVRKAPAKARKDLAKARKAPAKARKDLAKARKDLAKARKDLAKVRKDLAKARNSSGWLYCPTSISGSASSKQECASLKSLCGGRSRSSPSVFL